MIIHTVYKAQENLDYMEEWLQYHSDIGVKKFYLYDNSDGSGNWGMLQNNIPKNYSKDLIKHKYTMEQARELQKQIINKFNIEYVMWPNEEIEFVKPRGYAWNSSVIHFFNNYIETDLCAFIDMDEFIVKKVDFKECRMKSKIFKSRFYYKKVKDCHDILKQNVRDFFYNPNEFSTSKCIIDLTTCLKTHEIFKKDYRDDNEKVRMYDMHFRALELPEANIFINHYNMSKYRFMNLCKKKVKNLCFDLIFERTEKPLESLK